MDDGVQRDTFSFASLHCVEAALGCMMPAKLSLLLISPTPVLHRNRSGVPEAVQLISASHRFPPIAAPCIEAALGSLKLSRCQRFVAVTLPMEAPSGTPGMPAHDLYCCVVREISSGDGTA